MADEVWQSPCACNSSFVLTLRVRNKQRHCNNYRQYGIAMVIELLSEMIQGEFNMIFNGVNRDLEVVGNFSMGSVSFPAHLKYDSSLGAQ